MIGAYNLDEIKTNVENIIGYSQEYPFPVKVDGLINSWSKAKRKFINMFGGKTIYRTKEKISITLTDAEKADRVLRFTNELWGQGLMTEELAKFLEINYRGVFSNKVVMPYSNKDIKVGMKLSKSLGKFIEDANDLRTVQDKISVIMQDSTVSGYLYLSVDPRDFLTISENASGWRSCCSLDGGMRAGNLSYMVDETTVVAYLADERLKHYNALPLNMKWTDKKWRMLLYINDDAILYNRQYPFESFELRILIQNLMFEVGKYPYTVADYKIGTAFLHGETDNYKDRCFVKDLVDLSDFLGYCDFVKNDMLHHAHVKRDKWPNLAKVKVGGKVPCVRCGKRNIQYSNKFLCGDCIREVGTRDFYLNCPECGHRIYPSMNLVYLGDEVFCSKRCKEEFLREGEW